MINRDHFSNLHVIFTFSIDTSRSSKTDGGFFIVQMDLNVKVMRLISMYSIMTSNVPTDMFLCFCRFMARILI